LHYCLGLNLSLVTIFSRHGIAGNVQVFAPVDRLKF